MDGGLDIAERLFAEVLLGSGIDPSDPPKGAGNEGRFVAADGFDVDKEEEPKEEDDEIKGTVVSGGKETAPDFPAPFDVSTG